MTDREMLELAAKSAGLKFEHGYNDGLGFLYFPLAAHNDACRTPAGRFWNPLTDDGDALRLAVKLRFMIECSDDGHEVRVDSWVGYHWTELCCSDPCAAARLAIVRAAAAIGEQMEKQA